MIHVKRGRTPAAFNSPEIKAARQRVAKFYQPRKKGTYRFTHPDDFAGVAEALTKLFRHKCAYCESLLPKESPGESAFLIPFKSILGEVDYKLDYFRPVNGAVGLHGKVSIDHYWRLAYEWPNLYLACPDCSKLKGNKFPVKGERAAADAKPEELSTEEALLLDPCLDYPEEHLVFHESGKVVSETERGRVTIDVLGLNRSTLIKARLKVIQLLNEFRADLKIRRAFPASYRSDFYSPAMPHLALRRQFLQQWSAEAVGKNPGLKSALKEFLSFRTAFNFTAMPAAPPRARKGRRKKPAKRAAVSAEKTLRESVKRTAAAAAKVEETLSQYESYESAQAGFSVEKGTAAAARAYFSKTRFIERVRIHNFRVVADLDLPFPPLRPEEGSWLMLLGENGTGKSTILEAVAVALMGERARREGKFRPQDCLRYGTGEGYVQVFLTGSLEPVELRFRKGSSAFECKPDAEPKVLLLGYGATRLLPRRKHRPAAVLGAAKTQNLFDPFIPLSDATAWLYGLPKKVFDQIEDGLKQLLMLGEGDRFVKKRGRRQIEVDAFGTQTPLGDLSDGYQSVLALAADIMGVMRLRWKETPLSFVEGIVLVDEVDAHLHPRWKMRIVERLRKVFPRLQFLVTSHDPLCLRGLHAGEVVVMRRDAEERPFAITELPAPDALRIDQILTSEYFGLNTTIDPQTEALFDEYYHLLALRSPTAAQKKRVKELQEELKGLELMGTNRRERLMLEAADEYLASEGHIADGARRLELKEETREKLAEMWESL